MQEFEVLTSVTAQFDNYEPNDSQAKCIIENLLVPRFTNLSHHINTCQRQDMNVTRLCMAPQLYNVLDIMGNNYSRPQCQTEDEYVCTTVGKFFLISVFYVILLITK